MPSRKGALREAKRDADIPYNQEPLDIQYEPMRDRESAGGHVQKDGNGRVIQTREYYYENRKGDIIIIQDHSHEQGGQGAHFNVRPEGEKRNGHIGNTKDHYLIHELDEEKIRQGIMYLEMNISGWLTTIT